MSKITALIGRQAFELVRNRIGEILIDELGNQTILGNQFTDAEVIVEGNNIVDYTEMNTILVALAEGDYTNEHLGSTSGEYTFFVDCFSKSKSSATVDGAVNASFKVQALAGIVRYILKDPWYFTLGFASPFISRVTVSKVKIGESEKNDMINTTGARVVVKVWVNEDNTIVNPTLINSYHTAVILGTSAQGYTYNTVTP